MVDAATTTSWLSAAGELVTLGLVQAGDVEKGYVVRMPKAYPVYDEGYDRRVQVIREWLEAEVPNVHPVGRNGMHRYNNQDHSMMTAMLTVRGPLRGAFRHLGRERGVGLPRGAGRARRARRAGAAGGVPAAGATGTIRAGAAGSSHDRLADEEPSCPRPTGEPRRRSRRSSSPSWPSSPAAPACDASPSSPGGTSTTRRRAGPSCTRTRSPPDGPPRGSTWSLRTSSVAGRAVAGRASGLPGRPALRSLRRVRRQGRWSSPAAVSARSTGSSRSGTACRS